MLGHPGNCLNEGEQERRLRIPPDTFASGVEKHRVLGPYLGEKAAAVPVDGVRAANTVDCRCERTNVVFSTARQEVHVGKLRRCEPQRQEFSSRRFVRVHHVPSVTGARTAEPNDLDTNAPAMLSNTVHLGRQGGQPMSVPDDGMLATTSHVRGHIGEAVRTLREQQKLSVRTLAKRSGFSASFISQVEHGLASPSINSMEKIARELGVSLSMFFDQKDELQTPIVTRAGEGAELTSGWSQGTVRALSSSWPASTLEALLMTLSAGGRSGSEPSSHLNEEFAIVLAGNVLLHLSDEQRILQPGDSVHLAPHTPHRWENPTDRQARILLVSSRYPDVERVSAPDVSER